MTVVLGSGWLAFCCTRRWAIALKATSTAGELGVFRARGERIAAKGVTVVDDGTILNRRGSLNVDDEGTSRSATCLSTTASLKATCRMP